MGAGDLACNVCQGEVEMSYGERNRNVRFEPGNLDMDVSVAEPERSRVRSGVQAEATDWLRGDRQ